MQRFTKSVASMAMKKAAAPRMAFGGRFMSTIRFTESHEFVKMDGDVATWGITAHAADALGDIVYVDLPSDGAEFEKGESFGAVESVKAASDVYAPIDGEVVASNESLGDAPSKVNESPIEEGWFCKVKVGAAGKSQFEELMDEAAYKTHVENEEH